METCDIEDLPTDKLEIELWKQPANETLQTICAPFEENEFGNRLDEFGKLMIQTMQNKHGWGLAGPQVGLTKNIFVMRFPEDEAKAPIVVVNPELELAGDQWIAKEGCLSMPGIHGLVKRKMSVLMHYRTPLGERATLMTDHMAGRVIQHEKDHLEGIMIFERMTDKAAAKLLEEYFKWHR